MSFERMLPLYAALSLAVGLALGYGLGWLATQLTPVFF